MFERYTENARRAIFYSRYEASMLGSTFIETEHFLLGLVREDKTLLGRFLEVKTTLDELCEEIKRRITVCEKVSTSVDLPFSKACKRILEYAQEEAGVLDDRHIETEHLLLGILREENCLAAQILVEHGVQIDQVRAELPLLKRRNRDSVAVSSPIRHIEFWVSSMERSIRFYGHLFDLIGWKHVDQNGFACGGMKIYFREAHVHGIRNAPGPRHICFNAKDRVTVDEVAKILVSNGGTILRYPHEIDSPGIYMLVIQDPDGYVLEVAHKDEAQEEPIEK